MRVFEKRLNNKAGFTRNQTDKITNFIDGIFTRDIKSLQKYSIKVSVHRNCCAYFPAKKIGGFKHQWFWNTIVFSFQCSYYSYTYCSYSFSARSVPSCRDTKAGGIVRNPPTTQDIDTHLSATRWHYNIDICISVHISRTIRDKNKIKSCISYISFLSIL